MSTKSNKAIPTWGEVTNYLNNYMPSYPFVGILPYNFTYSGFDDNPFYELRTVLPEYVMPEQKDRYDISPIMWMGNLIICDGYDSLAGMRGYDIKISCNAFIDTQDLLDGDYREIIIPITCMDNTMSEDETYVSNRSMMVLEYASGIDTNWIAKCYAPGDNMSDEDQAYIIEPGQNSAYIEGKGFMLVNMIPL